MKRSRIWNATLVLLALSVAANFFLAGYSMQRVRQDASARVLLSEMAASYPPEVRREFRGIVRDNRTRTFGMVRELRSARAALAAAQKATPFNEAALKDAMTAVRTASTNLQATMQDYLLTALRNVHMKNASGG